VPVDSIVRVSFQSSVPANQAANNALVGDPLQAQGPGPFVKVGTAAYSCQGKTEIEVTHALAALGAALMQYASVVDFVAVTLVRREGV
jgi:hypothetical protein